MSDGHDHTFGEIGRCASCRATAIVFLRDGAHCFLLQFFTDDNTRSAIAVVRQHSLDFERVVETAWAVGANTGGPVAGEEIDVAVVERSAVPMYQLIYEPAATAALDALAAAESEAHRTRTPPPP